MDRFTVQVPGSTSNLGPGFDSLSLALQLYVKVLVKSRWDGRRKVNYRGVGASILKDESESLISRAIQHTWTYIGFPGVGFDLDVRNEIPLSSGLGSSGAAVVAGIEIALLLAKKKLTIHEKVRLGYEIEGHPDNILPSILGGFVISITSRNGQIEWIKCPFPSSIKIVAVTPEFAVSTRRAREVLPHEYGREDISFNLQRTAALVACLATGKWEGGLDIMADRIHQPYRTELIPGLEEMLTIKPGKDVLGIALSGSGPSVLALVRAKPQEIGKQLVLEFSKAGYRSTVRVLKYESKGVRVLGSKA